MFSIGKPECLTLRPLDERQTCLWLAAEAKAIGRGGIAAVTRATGVLGSQRIRRPGAGRKKLTEADETLVEDLG
jgi:hypothetical protein